METDDDMLGLFDKYAKNETFWWNVLFDVIGVDAYSLKDDMIPSASKICRPCSLRLIESYEFQKLCQKNWDKLILMTNGLFEFVRFVNIRTTYKSLIFYISEFVRKEEVKPPDLFKFKCNDCQLSFSESTL